MLDIVLEVNNCGDDENMIAVGIWTLTGAFKRVKAVGDFMAQIWTFNHVKAVVKWNLADHLSPD